MPTLASADRAGPRSDGRGRLAADRGDDALRGARAGGGDGAGAQGRAVAGRAGRGADDPRPGRRDPPAALLAQCGRGRCRRSSTTMAAAMSSAASTRMISSPATCAPGSGRWSPRSITGWGRSTNSRPRSTIPSPRCDGSSANAASLGADPGRLGVHGDSAGANLAAVVALMARDAGGPQLRLQSLVYPVADYTMSGASYGKFAAGYGILTRGRDGLVPRPLSAHAGRRRGLARLAAQGAEPCRRRRRRSSSPPNATYCTTTASAMPRPCAAPASRSNTGEYPGMIHAFFGMAPVGRRRDERPAPGLGRLQARFFLSHRRLISLLYASLGSDR